MGKFALITEKRNIQLNDVRKETRKRFDELKEKNEKSAPIETGYLTIEIVENISSIKEWKKGTMFVTQCYQELRKTYIQK